MIPPVSPLHSEILFQELQQIQDILEVVFLVFPQYCLGQGLMNMATNYMNGQILMKQGNF